MTAKRIVVVITLLLLGSLVYWASNCDGKTDEQLIIELFEIEDLSKELEDTNLLYALYAPTVITYDWNDTYETDDDTIFNNGIEEVIDFYQSFYDDYHDIHHTNVVVSISITGNTASIIKTVSGTQVYTATDELSSIDGSPEPWSLEKINGSWRVTEATYFFGNGIDPTHIRQIKEAEYDC